MFLNLLPKVQVSSSINLSQSILLGVLKYHVQRSVFREWILGGRLMRVSALLLSVSVRHSVSGSLIWCQWLSALTFNVSQSPKQIIKQLSAKIGFHTSFLLPGAKTHRKHYMRATAPVFMLDCADGIAKRIACNKTSQNNLKFVFRRGIRKRKDWCWW